MRIGVRTRQRIGGSGMMRATLAVLAVALLVPAAAAAGGGAKLVGFSSGSAPGDAGLFGMNALCRADYGRKARMCTTQEIRATVREPRGLPPVAAWVQTVPLSRDADVSGLPPASCSQWSSSLNDDWGMTVDDAGRITNWQKTCDVARPVACCVK